MPPSRIDGLLQYFRHLPPFRPTSYDHAAHKQLKALAENSRDPIARFDREGRFLYVNAAYCALTGRKAGETLGLKSAEIGLPEHSILLFDRHLREIVDHPAERDFEIEFPDSAGPRWFEARLIPEQDADGKIVSILVVLREFTERWRLEQQRQELERQQRALLDGIAERAWLKDISGRYLAVNQQFAALTPYSASDLIGKTARDIVPYSVAAQCEKEDREAMETCRVLRAVRPSALDRYATWRETIKVPLLDKEGRTVGLICSSRDITEHKRAADRLEASEHRLKLALRAAKSGAWEWNPATGESNWTDEAYAVVGLSPGKNPAMYSSWIGRVHPDDRERVSRLISECVESGAEFRTEYRVILDDGNIRWISDVGVMQGQGESRRMTGINTDITEHKLLEKKRHELEYAQRALLDGIPDAAWLKDLDGRLLAVNLEYERRCGSPRDRILGLKTGDLRSEEISRIIDAEDQQIIRTGQPLRIERATHYSSSTFWRELIKVPIKDDKGNVIGTAGVSRDVTERKSIEQALQQSKEMLNTILDASPTAIIAYDKLLNITFWNTAAERMFGWTANELLGQQLPILPPENRCDLDALQQAMLCNEMLTNIEAVWRKRDGTPVEILLSGSTIRDAAHQVTGSVVICTDVTSRNHEQRRLRDFEEQFRLLAEDVHAVFWISNDDFSRIDYISPGFDGLWGMSREEVYRDPMAWRRNIHHDDLPVVENFLRAQADGQPASAECRVVHSSGGIRWIRARSFPHKSHRLGNCVTGIVTDITDVKVVAADRLAHAERQRDTLVREVHHRIKNHLQGVAGLLRLHASETPSAKSTLERAITQVQSVAIIHGLQGRRAGSEILLCEMIPAIAQMARTLSGTEAEIRTEILAEHPVQVVENESVPVALIITELVNNAIKHSTPPGSAVNVTVRMAQDSTLILISNRGLLSRGPGTDSCKFNGGAGLELVHALMPPRGASFELLQSDTGVEARLTLSYPVIVTAPNPGPTNKDGGDG